jgi:hypothetical protein
MRSAIIGVAGAVMLGLLSTAPSLGQGAGGISSYLESVDVANDGSAKVAVDATVTGGTSDTIVLPLNFAGAKNFAAEADGIGIASVGAAKTGDISLVTVRLARVSTGKMQLKVTFTADRVVDWSRPRLPRGVYSLAYTFTNTSSSNIGDYELRMLLPRGYDMNSIISSTPRATGEEVVPPCVFATEDGRLVVTLRSKSVDAGKVAAITFGVRARGGSPVPAIVIGLLIAALGLYLKRDVLTREDFVREVSA